MPERTNTPPPITEKVTCSVCNKFFGFIRRDGSGPVFEECPHVPAARVNNPTVNMLIQEGRYKEAADLVKKLKLRPPACPLEIRMGQYQPKPQPLGVGGDRGGPIDEDAGSYQSVARRALEDKENDYEG